MIPSKVAPLSGSFSSLAYRQEEATSAKPVRTAPAALPNRTDKGMVTPGECWGGKRGGGRACPARRGIRPSRAGRYGSAFVSPPSGVTIALQTGTAMLVVTLRTCPSPNHLWTPPATHAEAVAPV